MSEIFTVKLRLQSRQGIFLVDHCIWKNKPRKQENLLTFAQQGFKLVNICFHNLITVLNSHMIGYNTHSGVHVFLSMTTDRSEECSCNIFIMLVHGTARALHTSHSASHSWWETEGFCLTLFNVLFFIGLLLVFYVSFLFQWSTRRVHWSESHQSVPWTHWRREQKGRTFFIDTSLRELHFIKSVLKVTA